MDSITPDDFFAGSPQGLAVFRRVNDLVTQARPDITVRTSKSQVAFRSRRGFAYLWRPGQYLRNPAAEVVLSIVLPRRASSQRFKQVVHPAPTVWMHHLEIRSVDDVDREVELWLLEAADAAEPVHPAGRKRR
jgi:Domain of unknown function (DUF5655)